MKFYTFLPGFIVVLTLIILLTVQTVFKLDVPIIKNIKHPVLILLALGFMLCAFGTTGHSILHLIKDGFNIPVALMILFGILILVFSYVRFVIKVPFFMISTDAQTYMVLLSLIGLKIIIATVRVIHWSCN